MTSRHPERHRSHRAGWLRAGAARRTPGRILGVLAMVAAGLIGRLFNVAG